MWKKSGPRKKLVENKDTFQYVPLLENLASILQNKGILIEVSILKTVWLSSQTNNYYFIIFLL